MERALILLMAALMVSVAPGVQGTDHLSFANDTKVNITRAGCGTSKLCVEQPDDCDPAGNTRCLFTSVVASNMSHLSIELSGESQGFIAVGLNMNGSEDTSMLFICAQDNLKNGTFFFRTMKRHNTSNKLDDTETRVTEIRGTVNDDMIQCEFDIPNVTSLSSTRSSHGNHLLLFSIILGNGSTTGSNISDFNVNRITDVLNLANPDGSLPTGNGAGGAAQLHAVLLLLSVLVLSVTLRA